MKKPKRWSYSVYVKMTMPYDSYTWDKSDYIDLFYANKPLIDWQEQRIKELENILQDFLTTKEDPYTWISEMRSTIDDVLNE